MRWKEPLTKNDLRDIQERNMDSADVRALLWEIARLRGIMLYADQLQRLISTLPGPQGQVLESLRSTLLTEPCVLEFPRL
jgi:hypothetical protein